MSATVGDVVVRVGGDVTTLKQGMAEGSRSVKEFSSEAARHLRKTTADLAKVGAGAVAAGAALVAGLYTKGTQVIGVQNDLAQSLNTTVASVAALQHAAKMNAIDGMEGSLTRLNRRLGAAEFGAGAAAVTVKKLNLDLEALAKMPVDERVASIADSIRDSGMSFQQAARHLQNLGFEQKEATALFMQGGDVFREARKEAEQLGLALSDVDAERVAAADDAIKSIGNTLQVVANTVAVELSPYLQEIGDRFAAASKESGGFKNEVAAGINTSIKGFAKVADVLHGLRVSIKGVEVVAVGFGAGVATSAEISLQAIQKLVGGTSESIQRLGKYMSYLPGSVGATGKALQALGVIDVDTVVDGAEDLRNRLIDVRAEMHELAMQEMPSQKVEKFLADVVERSKEAAAEVVAARQAIGAGEFESDAGSEQAGTSTDAGGSGDAEARAMAAALEAIKRRYVTEEQLLREHRETMALIGEEFDVARFETEAEWRSVREQAEQEHIQRMHDINASGYDGIQNLMHARWGKVAAETAGAMKSIVGTVAVGSRKAFEVSKAWAVSDALISTYQGIAAGVKLGWPMAIPAVAWAAATGFAQLSNIKNQSFGGAGGAAASGNGTPATAGNPVGVGGSTSAPQQDRVMRVEGVDSGSLFSGNQLRGLVEAIDEFRADGGGRVVFA